MKSIARIAILLSAALVLMACSISINLGDTAQTPIPSGGGNPTISIATPSESVTQPTIEILLPTKPAEVLVTVYFMDENHFVAGTEPYEVPVQRLVPADSNLPLSILNLYFAGPTPDEYAHGLRLVSSGFTYVRNLEIENGIARVFLGGVCSNNGAAYSVANLIMKNLSQFPEITSVKIFDENDSNLDPDSQSSSLPYCLEP